MHHSLADSFARTRLVLSGCAADCVVTPSHNESVDMQAGGLGSTGQERVLDVCPEKVHQRVPLFVGSPKEVEYLESFIKK